MRRVYGLALLGLVAGVSAFVGANDDLAGTWALTGLAPKGATAQTELLFKLDTKDGKTTATVVASSPQITKAEITSFAKTADHVSLTVAFSAAKGGKGGKMAKTQTLTFEGFVSADGKKIVGVIDQTLPAYMAPSTAKTLEAADLNRKVPADELATWAESVSNTAKDHNAPWAVDVNNRLANVFLAQNNTSLALRYAYAAEQALTSKSATQAQLTVLETLSKALKKAEEGHKAVAERMAKLDKILDDEYLAAVPSFKGKSFAGRKSQSDRVVFMELFTGAECPDCISSDVAFDVLQKSYGRSELVLVQYHKHIPGPDPMTNPSSEARWNYYLQAHGRKGVPGTPTILFNGSPISENGGPMRLAEQKYLNYCGFVNPLLETAAGCKITASAKRVGDKIQIQTEVSGLKNPGKDMKLRLVLVEETIRFVGGNKLRFHHQVARAMPGGADGVAVVQPQMTTKNEVDVAGVRKDLTAYLDAYAANPANRPFPRAARPLGMENLRVIAFVQDDASKERQILQAVQVNVEP